MIARTLRAVGRQGRHLLLPRSTGSRPFHAASANFSKAYDHDGKTKVTIFNTETDLGLMVTGYSQYGFRLNNDMVLIGPITVFPRSVLSWNVNSFEDINEESLSLFPTLEPKIDVLIIGIGDQAPPPALSKRIIEFMKKYKINVEILRTEQACATFNFLNAENRMVACALIPPLHLTYNENDILQAKLRKKELYETE
ncbi:NADH dehydrogenase [ubiquinone] 1 alpha subcomplex assembly factor 3 [Drosophila biarmipes]|uniref:NADH dehydrogenase [ubiquinone] 1 alpha subcomplex assembly factor 3 n=1 Tax=Drosophila biarmipes TaxID=125945 RepID=UPI0007E68C8F|nr:NADH dehydrogenase [ubiquinone] 1 alpha subcomplex assembly factor 3 [Drosophila biarmipes]